MYSLIFAPVHSPNFEAPAGFNEKSISYSSAPARDWLAVALRNCAPSTIAGDSITTHFFGGCQFGLALASWPASSERSVYGSTRRFVGTLPPLLSEAMASCSLAYVCTGP